MNRTHLVGLLLGVAAVAAASTWGVSSVAFQKDATRTAYHATAARVGAAQQDAAAFTMSRKQIEGLSTMALQRAPHADPLLSMTPAQLAGVGLGTGYQVPNAQTPPSAADILASMSPGTRRYTESIMNLTFAQLAAGGAGHP